MFKQINFYVLKLLKFNHIWFLKKNNTYITSIMLYFYSNFFHSLNSDSFEKVVMIGFLKRIKDHISMSAEILSFSYQRPTLIGQDNAPPRSNPPATNKIIWHIPLLYQIICSKTLNSDLAVIYQWSTAPSFILQLLNNSEISQQKFYASFITLTTVCLWTADRFELLVK